MNRPIGPGTHDLMGSRFRLHVKHLPGRPDLVFPKLRKVIFVHGCFWHMHSCKYGRIVPATNTRFWQDKRKANVIRDRSVAKALRRAGWHVKVLWECQLKDSARIEQSVLKFLHSTAIPGLK